MGRPGRQEGQRHSLFFVAVPGIEPEALTWLHLRPLFVHFVFLSLLSCPGWSRTWSPPASVAQSARVKVTNHQTQLYCSFYNTLLSEEPAIPAALGTKLPTHEPWGPNTSKPQHLRRGITEQEAGSRNWCLAGGFQRQTFWQLKKWPQRTARANQRFIPFTSPLPLAKGQGFRGVQKRVCFVR